MRNRRTATISVGALMLVALTGCYVGVDGEPVVTTVTAPAPTVTVTPPAPPLQEPAEQPLTDQEVNLLHSVCSVLNEIPSEAAVSEYLPQPNVASAQENAFLADTFLNIAQNAFDLLKDSDVTQTVMGAWVSADAIAYDTVGAQLKSSTNSWLTNPTPVNFSYWNTTFGYAVYKVQETKACTTFFNTYSP